MKNLFIAATLAFVALGSTAHAESFRVGVSNFVDRVSEDMEVTYGLGSTIPSSNQNDRDEGFSGTVRATWPLDRPRFGGAQRLGLDFTGGENDGFANDDVGYQAAMAVWELQYDSVRYLSDYGVEPYVVLGAGVARLEGRGAEAGDHFAIQYGVGLRREFGDRLALGGEVRSVQSSGDVVDDRHGNSNLNVTNVLATLTYDF